jgi:CheY-like chemotaxis protein
MYIVFVDDDANVRSSTAELLRLLGVEVAAFSDAWSAIDSVTDRCPDAVLIDLNMPAMDGFEVAQVLRERFGRTLRLVAFSGVTSTFQREAAAHAGFDVFLAKPCTGVAMIQALTRPPIA